ncbi:equilibrative nucleoside transporter 4, partial [Biomphalaria glabrata]
RLEARLEVVRLIYPYMASFALTFYVSVSLYPGIISEVVSCRLGTWMPVVLMACFNVTDTMGKMLAAVIHNYSKLRLLLCTLTRICLIPLVVLCIKPRSRPILSGEAWSIFITILLGLSNGYFGCLPLVLAPSQVTPRLRELCGNTMMLSFTLAIVAGTFTSYGLDILVGPHPDLELCHRDNSTFFHLVAHGTNFSSVAT